MDFGKKDGKHQWSVVTNIIDGWKLVKFNIENAKKLMNLFKDLQTQFGLDPPLIVSTAGTSDMKVIPLTISGEYYEMQTLSILRMFSSISIH